MLPTHIGGLNLPFDSQLPDGKTTNSGQGSKIERCMVTFGTRLLAHWTAPPAVPYVGLSWAILRARKSSKSSSLVWRSSIMFTVTGGWADFEAEATDRTLEDE